MLIRAEQDTDRAAVYAVNASAFETPLEANLVDALRNRQRRLCRWWPRTTERLSATSCFAGFPVG